MSIDRVLVGNKSKPPQGALKAIYCLSPPAPYYAETKLTDQVEFTLHSDWESPAAAQRFCSASTGEGDKPVSHFHQFKNITRDPRLLLVVEIVEVNVGKAKMAGESVTFAPPKSGLINTIGWTVVPIFSRQDEKYTAIGNYQVRRRR